LWFDCGLLLWILVVMVVGFVFEVVYLCVEYWDFVWFGSEVLFWVVDGVV